MPSEPPPRPRTRSNARLTQATLDEGLIAPPKIPLPRPTMKPCPGTRTDEVAALRLLLPRDGSNPYQGPFSSALRIHAPRVFDESRHKNLISVLYNHAMNDLDTYVAIDELLKTTFRASAVDINVLHRRNTDDIGRYMYAPQLAHLLKSALKADRSESVEESKIALGEDEDLDETTIAAIDAAEPTTNVDPLFDNMTQTQPDLSLINVPTPPTRSPPRSPGYDPPLYVHYVRLPSGQGHDEDRDQSIERIEKEYEEEQKQEEERKQEEELTSPASNNGTPRSTTEPIDYAQIINNPYDPNAPFSDSDETATVIADAANLHQDNFEEEIANNHNDIENDLEDYFQNQDLLQAQEGEVSSLNAEAEEEYEDEERYLREGQEYEKERRQSLERIALERREPDGNLIQTRHNIHPTTDEISEDEHSIFFQMRTIMAQITEDKATITELAKQVRADQQQVRADQISISDLNKKINKQSISVRADKAATTEMRLETLTALKNIQRIETTITEETKQFLATKEEAATRLKDQSEAISVNIGRVEAQLTTTQKLFTEGAVTMEKLKNGNEQGNNIIRAITSLKSTKEQAKDAKQRIKEYGNKIIKKIDTTAAQVPTPTTALLSKDIDYIQQQVNKSKKFWADAKSVLLTETKTQLIDIRVQAKTIFDDQCSALKSQVEAIHSNADTRLQQHDQRVEEASEKMSTERANHMKIMGSRKQTMDTAHQRVLTEFNTQRKQFQHDAKEIAKEACDEIDIAATTVREELEVSVETHLNSESMKRVLSSNALDCFTEICDSNSPKIVEKVEATARTILERDTWIHEHVRTIAADAAVYDKSFGDWQKRPVSATLQQPRMLSRKPSVKKAKNRNDCSMKNRNVRNTPALPKRTDTTRNRIRIERREEKGSTKKGQKRNN